MNRTIPIIASAVILLILAAIALYFFTPLGSQLVARLMPTSIPQELQGAAFLSDTGSSNTALYRFPASGQTNEDAGATLVSASQNGKGTARITRSADGRFKVSIDTITVLQDTAPRIGIDVAPDGRSIVFAVASDTAAFVSPSRSPRMPLTRGRWNAYLYIPASHKSLALGPGVSPFFIDQTHIGWMAPAGLSVVDLASGASRVLVPDTAGQSPSVTLLSPDHSIIGWYQGNAKVLQLYKVTATTAQALAKTTVPDGIRSITLGNEALYELRTSGSSMEIMKQPFGGTAAIVGRLPASLNISRIFLGSI